MQIKTASWFSLLPPGHVRIGISRGVPNWARTGLHYPDLNPGPWFNSVPWDEYCRRYQAILDQRDPHQVAADVLALANGGISLLVCFEQPGRGMVSPRPGGLLDGGRDRRVGAGVGLRALAAGSALAAAATEAAGCRPKCCAPHRERHHGRSPLPAGTGRRCAGSRRPAGQR
jgi:hypothetical protein